MDVFTAGLSSKRRDCVNWNWQRKQIMERTRRATIDLFDIRLIADVLSSLTDLHKLRRIDINYKVLEKNE